jgi:hypothetical protein
MNDITCVPIITYPDFCILSVVAGGHQKFFYLENEGMGMVSHEVQYVYGLCADEFEPMDMTEILDACPDDYDISGETDDGQEYIFFKFVG